MREKTNYVAITVWLLLTPSVTTCVSYQNAYRRLLLFFTGYLENSSRGVLFAKFCTHSSISGPRKNTNTFLVRESKHFVLL